MYNALLAIDSAKSTIVSMTITAHGKLDSNDIESDDGGPALIADVNGNIEIVLGVGQKARISRN